MENCSPMEQWRSEAVIWIDNHATVQARVASVANAHVLKKPEHRPLIGFSLRSRVVHKLQQVVQWYHDPLAGLRARYHRRRQWCLGSGQWWFCSRKFVVMVIVCRMLLLRLVHALRLAPSPYPIDACDAERSPAPPGAHTIHSRHCPQFIACLERAAYARIDRIDLGSLGMLCPLQFCQIQNVLVNVLRRHTLCVDQGSRVLQLLVPTGIGIWRKEVQCTVIKQTQHDAHGGTDLLSTSECINVPHKMHTSNSPK